MSIIYVQNDGESAEAVRRGFPFPVSIEGDFLPALSGRTITRMVQVPGIGTGAAYQDGDAFGTLITFPDVFRPEKRSGAVVVINWYDLDDEGVNKDIAFFTRPVTATTDNSAAALSDSDLLACVGVVSISTWYNWGNNQMGTAKDFALWVQSEDTNLYALVVTRGADNISAGAIPRLAVVVVPD